MTTRGFCLTCLLAGFSALLPCMAFAHGVKAVQLKVTDSGYLRGPQASVMLYSNTASPIFGDQKDAALQIILRDHRVATDGTLRLAPTPEQWSRLPILKGRHADKANGRLDASLSYPAYHLDYRVTVSAERGGFRIAVSLDKPLPVGLVGRMGFNLDFLPSIYAGKPYLVDGAPGGILPHYPEGKMVADPPPPGVEPMASPWRKYVAQWRKARKYMVPRPLAAGNRVVLAPGKPTYRVAVTSVGSKLELYDGRNQGLNGWFVLRSLIPAGKTSNAIVWHVKLDRIPAWTRAPLIAHSQVGYAASTRKVAVIGLGAAATVPATASLLRLSANGTFQTIYRAPVSSPRRWLRYKYVKFDFSSVRKPGLYKIEYAGSQTRPFPIAKNVYGNTWQTSLDGFMAEQMDHVSVRDTYHLWHGVAHMDDARQAPPNVEEFDGYWMGPNTFSPYKPGQHIPGLNVGGWFDAGDFDSDAFDQLLTIRNLALTATTFHPGRDELSVDEKARTVIMHQPDGIPDVVQQVEHGVLQTLAQIHAVGHVFMGIHAPTLQEYTFVGDAASQTDGLVYDSVLGPQQVLGEKSAVPDDRWAWTNYDAAMDYSSIASLAEASVALNGWNHQLARQSLQTAIERWKSEQAHPGPNPIGPPGYRLHAQPPAAPYKWLAAVDLLVATKGAQPYKATVEKLFRSAIAKMWPQGWTVVRALPYLPPNYKRVFKKVLVAQVSKMRQRMAKTPFGLPPSNSRWGNSAQVARYGAAMYFLHKAFPEVISAQPTITAANYLLGTHPVSSVSYIAGIGENTKPQTYSNNRGDHSYLPGGMIPGYIVIKPDFPECITDFGMLWFEDETTIGAASSWILEANAASAIVNQERRTKVARQ